MFTIAYWLTHLLSQYLSIYIYVQPVNFQTKCYSLAGIMGPYIGNFVPCLRALQNILLRHWWHHLYFISSREHFPTHDPILSFWAIWRGRMRRREQKLTRKKRPSISSYRNYLLSLLQWVVKKCVLAIGYVEILTLSVTISLRNWVMCLMVYIWHNFYSDTQILITERK